MKKAKQRRTRGIRTKQFTKAATKSFPNVKRFGIEIAIKPTCRLPKHPKHRNFGGKAARLVMFTSGRGYDDLCRLNQMMSGVATYLGFNQYGKWA